MATKKKENETDLNDLTVDELRDKAEEQGVDVSDCKTKAEIISKLQSAGSSAPRTYGTPLEAALAKPSPREDEIEWADPDLDKPVLNTLDGRPVQVVIVKGVPIPKEGKPVLVFVGLANGAIDFVSAEQASLTKFAQDVDGQIYYAPHGFMGIPPGYKALDLDLLAE
jgi:hypothetical protein